MVRKQLYIEEGQERAIQRRAKALGVSEAEVVRSALAAALAAESAPAHRPLLEEDDPLELAIAFAAEDAIRGHSLPAAGYHREDLYAEREARLVKRAASSRSPSTKKQR